MDKLKAMETVVRIEDAGSLTAAARTLGVSLPAVVRTLAALEAHLAVRLFHRTTRRVVPTEEGRQYIEQCRQLLQAIDDTEAELTADAVQLRGPLTVTAPVLFGRMYVAPAITRFLQHHGQVRVALRLQDQLVDLLEEQVDLGIRIGVLEDSSLIAQPLGHVRRIVAASPAYLAQHAVPLHPRDLLQTNCLGFSAGPGRGWSFDEDRHSFSVPVQGNLECNQVGPLLDACLAGLGFGMFLSYQIAPYLQQGLLQAVLESFEPPPRPLHIVYPHARRLPGRTRALIAWLKQELRRGSWCCTTDPA